MYWKRARYDSIVIYLTVFVILVTNQMAFGFIQGEKNQQEHFGDVTFDENIQTVMIRSTSWELSAPVLELGSEQRLELIFDDLSGKQNSYGYTLVHCDAGWNRSDLEPQEYLSGLGQGSLYESDPSLNTTYDYFHYRLVLPEEECMPVISGNYALVVFDTDEPDRVVITRRFFIVEDLMQLDGRVIQPATGDFRETGQQVHFTLIHDNLPIQDPLRDLDIVVRQNGRDDNIIKSIKPSFIFPGKIEYARAEEGIFPGGNEFRTLDIKSLKYQTENIASMDFQNPYYHVYMKPDKSKENSPYFSKVDLNGRYFINREKAQKKHLEADYVYVHFCLEQPYPLQEEVYVAGELTNWSASGSNKMEYNAGKKCYEANVLLKQGLYDYAFAVSDKARGQLNLEVFEGNYYETVNDYEIFVYLHDSRSGYDRLVGYLPMKR
jgi:hypothetical protein